MVLVHPELIWEVEEFCWQTVFAKRVQVGRRRGIDQRSEAPDARPGAMAGEEPREILGCRFAAQDDEFGPCRYGGDRVVARRDLGLAEQMRKMTMLEVRDPAQRDRVRQACAETGIDEI